MFNIDDNKLLLYKKNEKVLLNEYDEFFIQKIYLLERLFSRGMKKCSYNPGIKAEYNFVSDNYFISHFAGGISFNKSISELDVFDSRTFQELKKIDSAYLRSKNFEDKNSAKIVEYVTKEMSHFLCLPDINPDNRFDLYIKNSMYYFNQHNQHYFVDFIEHLKRKQNYISPQIEFCEQMLPVIPDFNSSKRDFREFHFKQILNHHICPAIKHTFLYPENTKIILNINLYQRTIHTITHGQGMTNTFMYTENQALLPEKIFLSGILQIETNDLYKSLSAAIQRLLKILDIDDDKLHMKEINQLHNKIITYCEKETLTTQQEKMISPSTIKSIRI